MFLSIEITFDCDESYQVLRTRFDLRRSATDSGLAIPRVAYFTGGINPETAYTGTGAADVPLKAVSK